MIDNISIQRLNLLHPLIREEAIKAYKEAVALTPVGVHPVIVQTLRTFEEQDLLYQKGRTRPGPRVTNAKPGTSYHQWGMAIDFCIMVNERLVWKVDANWMKVVECFKARGFTWGGDFKSLKDPPHFEKNLGMHWRELIALYKAHKIDDKGYVILETPATNLA